MNKITSLQTVMVRRINRQFQIVVNGDKLTAFLPIYERRTVIDGATSIQQDTIASVLTVQNTKDGVTIETYTVTAWKRLYWRKWRQSRKDYQTYTSKNFNELIKKARVFFEK